MREYGENLPDQLDTVLVGLDDAKRSLLAIITNARSPMFYAPQLKHHTITKLWGMSNSLDGALKMARTIGVDRNTLNQFSVVVNKIYSLPQIMSDVEVVDSPHIGYAPSTASQAKVEQLVNSIQHDALPAIAELQASLERSAHVLFGGGAKSDPDYIGGTDTAVPVRNYNSIVNTRELFSFWEKPKPYDPNRGVYRIIVTMINPLLPQVQSLQTKLHEAYQKTAAVPNERNAVQLDKLRKMFNAVSKIRKMIDSDHLEDIA